MVFGCGSIAQSTLSLGVKGDFFSINWGWVSISTIALLFVFQWQCCKWMMT